MQDSTSRFRLMVWTALAASLILAGCGGGSTDSSANAQSSGSSASGQSSGSGETLPGPTTASATLDWVAPTTNTNGSALTDLRGYRIYYGTRSNQLTNTIAITSPGMATYVIDGLQVGTTYYFAITAVTSSGMESADSAVVVTRIS
jgi:hypothetical protein